MPKTLQQPKPRAARGPARFTRSEATRLLKGAIAAGMPVHGVEVDTSTGALRVLLGTPKSAPTAAAAGERG
jgi:hypothetical protein